ncbi:hypothetical protein ACEQ8H_004663 [Pleosporales sp. CAS-2024a]
MAMAHAHHAAFFYGTLMAPPVLHRVLWASPTPPTPAHATQLRIRPAVLHAHQRHRVRHADYPALVPASPSASVRGTLVEGLSDADLWRLDVFEGHEYARTRVDVRLLRDADADADADGPPITADTYVWVAGRERLEAQEWDFVHFVQDKMQAWVGDHEPAADQGFRDVDDAVAALRDPTGGRGVHGDIARQLTAGAAPREDKLLESAL